MIRWQLSSLSKLPSELELRKETSGVFTKLCTMRFWLFFGFFLFYDFVLVLNIFFIPPSIYGGSKAILSENIFGILLIIMVILANFDKLVLLNKLKNSY